MPNSKGIQFNGQEIKWLCDALGVKNKASQGSITAATSTDSNKTAQDVESNIGASTLVVEIESPQERLDRLKRERTRHTVMEERANKRRFVAYQQSPHRNDPSAELGNPVKEKAYVEEDHSPAL